jgi:transcriptional regulator with XRE-family HTH domain
MYDINLGEQIRLAREAKGLTQGELAERLGTTQAAVSYVEQRRRLRMSVVARYAEVLGLPVAILVQAGGAGADDARARAIREAFAIVGRDDDFGFGARGDERLSLETMLDIIRLYERYKGVHLLEKDFV